MGIEYKPGDRIKYIGSGSAYGLSGVIVERSPHVVTSNPVYHLRLQHPERGPINWFSEAGSLELVDMPDITLVEVPLSLMKAAAEALSPRTPVDIRRSARESLRKEIARHESSDDAKRKTNPK